MKNKGMKRVGLLVGGVLLICAGSPLAAVAADSIVAKGSPAQADICNKELKWGVANCDREFREHQDTRKHADCLAAVRAKYDTCMDPGSK